MYLKGGSALQQSQRVARKGLQRMVSGIKKGIKERWKLLNEIILMALQASCFMVEKRKVTQ